MFDNDNKLSDKLTMFQHGILNYQVLDGMADWVRVVSKDGIVIYANKAMKRDLGENIIGSHCYKILNKDDRCIHCITLKSIFSGETFQKEEIVNGRYYSVKSSPVRNTDGDIVAAVEVFRDVTRERKLELELLERNKLISEDLKFAKKVQEKILPRQGMFENLNIEYIYKASEMLSGDMFDVFHIDDENIGIYISDVAGHGIAASMLTMFIKQMMRDIKDEIKTPSLALLELHKRFLAFGLEADKYFTIFYGVYNRTKNTFSYSNAGHNCYPIKFNDKDVNPLKIKGYPITVLFDQMNYEEKIVKLNYGDKILLYTDGITEAMDYNGKQFGIEGVLETVRNHPNNLLQEIEEKFIVHSWGEQKDDYALVLVEVTK
ncbi:MAG TPA: SpoIIE family protein phosphatase [Soehngenia sp.]|nr:SpoIIE family protein phosphatase [Soehngenia sp.]HPP31605.1 SpoIIE family protein phosphatase [Soehngenia sp.]